MMMVMMMIITHSNSMALIRLLYCSEEKSLKLSVVFELVCDKFIHYIEPLADLQVMKVKAEHPEKENWTELLPQRPNVSKFDLFPIV